MGRKVVWSLFVFPLLACEGPSADEWSVDSHELLGRGGGRTAGGASGGGSAGGSGGGPAPLTPCPSSGAGAVISTSGCFTFTPAEAGASSTGVNATEPNYALEPVGAPKGRLLVYLNASLSHPAMQIASPQQNVYTAAANSGLHVIAVSYASNQVIGGLCKDDAACYPSARAAVLFGEPGVLTLAPDETVVARTLAALRLLAARRPGQGWAQFFDANGLVASRLVLGGHSQGGGHAAFFGKRVAVHSVIQLSSTCDQVGTQPAPWLADGNWATVPSTHYWGLGSAGDTTCPIHAAAWTVMGLGTRGFDDAVTCFGGNGQHGASVFCTGNWARWLSFFSE